MNAAYWSVEARGAADGKIYSSCVQRCLPLHVQYAFRHVAGAVEDIEMLFYHVGTVEEVNFTQQWGSVVVLKLSKPSVYQWEFAQDFTILSHLNRIGDLLQARFLI